MSPLEEIEQSLQQTASNQPRHATRHIYSVNNHKMPADQTRYVIYSD